MKLNKYILCIMVFIWMIVIYGFSNMNTNESNGKSKMVIYNVSKLCIDITNKVNITNVDSKVSALNLTNKLNIPLRKVAHATVYFILGIILINAFKYFKAKKIYLYSLIICFIYACTDEFHQSFVSGRGPSFRDVLIDTLGCIISIVICYFINKVLVNKKNVVINEEV